MNLQEIYHSKSKFVVRAVGNELILVPLTGNVAQMSELFTLNETGRFIWENINATNTLQDIVGAMTDTFEIDTETAQKDVETFVIKLQSML